MKRWKKLAFAGLIWCSFFAVLELSLRIVGFAPATDRADLYAGFSRQIPLLTRVRLDGIDDVMQTASNKLVWFNAFEFPAKKPANTKRVFCLGGSTTYGRPWDDKTSFAGWLREFFPAVSPEHNWEVINAGGISYASYRVVEVMRELSQFEPDLFIVYTGQNEYLEDRTFRDLSQQSSARIAITSWVQHTAIYSAAQSLLRAPQSDPAVKDEPTRNTNEVDQDNSWIPSPEVNERLNHTIGPTDYVRDDENSARVVKDLEANLDRMIDIAASCQAMLIMVTPASNEDGCEPFKSQFTDEVSDQDIELVLTTLATFDRRDASSIQKLNAALDRQPRYAELQYRVGQMLAEQGKRDDALNSFRRAIDEDVCPLRASSAVTSTIRRVASRRNVVLVDFEKKLRSKVVSESGNPCFGNRVFVDHVHPNISTHQQLAIWIIQELQNAQFLNDRPLSREQIADIDGRVRAKLDTRRQAIAFRNLAKLWNWCGRFQSCADAARQCLTTLPRDSESRFLLADSLVQTGQLEEAADQYDLLFTLDPNRVEAFIPAGILYAELGEWNAAERYLALGLLFDPGNTSARYAIERVQHELAVPHPRQLPGNESTQRDDLGDAIQSNPQ